MVLGDDSKSSGQLPSLPDLPGMAGLGQGEAQTRQTSVNVKPEFSGKDAAGEKDLSVVVDLPGARIAQGADAARAVPAAADESDPYLGRLFGNYELVTKVGQGGMGLVYKGRQVSLDRVVAVKILNKALCDNAEFIKRFEREAKSIARINHPNIMAVYDFGKTDGLYYMVTEFIEGSSLSKQITDRLMMPVEDLAPLLVQCLAGLAHVGTNGIVHRDIKPDNILITRDGIAKIADFGLAKDVSGNDHTDLTTVGLAMGTPAYMSPEQCMGRKLDGRSDIYSLGVTAYLALTGEKPFTGQSSFEIMTKQREFNPPPPRQLNPNIPKEVSDLVIRMLAKNPQDRFRDGEECRQAWMETGQRLGFLRSQNLGNDSVLLGPERSKNVRASGVMPVPPSAMAVASPVAPPEPMSAMPKPMPEPIRAPAMDSNKSKSRLSGEFQAPPSEPEPKPSGRSTTEKRMSSRAPAAGEAFTCPRCGMLNRADQVNCSRCNHELHDSGNDPNAAKGQEAEAQRLLTNGQYRDAAAVYARLADRENDRRARAILRTKEREARTLEHQNQVSEIQSLTQGLLNRGDLKGGIELLERGLRDVRDAGASSTGAETKLMEEIGSLRTRLRRRRQLRTVLIVVVIAALVTGAVLAKFYLASQATTASPPAVPTPAAPSH